MPKENHTSIFTSCSMCKKTWSDRNTFLKDTSLELNGYQADIDKLDQGLLFFTHRVDGCHSTLSLRVKVFYDLNPGRRFRENKHGSEECPGYCLLKQNLQVCPVRCECAFIRDLVSILHQMKKT